MGTIIRHFRAVGRRQDQPGARRCSPRGPNLVVSVSHTTRKPRANEVDGRDYHFVTPAQFHELVAAGRVSRARAGVRQLLRHRRGAGRRDKLAAGKRRAARDRLAGRTPGAPRDARQHQHLHPAAVARRARAAPARAPHRQRRDHRAPARRCRRPTCRTTAEFDYVVVNDHFERRRADWATSSTAAAASCAADAAGAQAADASLVR